MSLVNGWVVGFSMQGWDTCLGLNESSLLMDQDAVPLLVMGLLSSQSLGNGPNEI